MIVGEKMCELINELKEISQQQEVSAKRIDELINMIESVLSRNSPQKRVVASNIELVPWWNGKYIIYKDGILRTEGIERKLEFLRNFPQLLNELIERLKEENVEVEKLLRELKEAISKF